MVDGQSINLMCYVSVAVLPTLEGRFCVQCSVLRTFSYTNVCGPLCSVNVAYFAHYTFDFLKSKSLLHCLKKHIQHITYKIESRKQQNECLSED